MDIGRIVRSGCAAAIRAYCLPAWILSPFSKSRGGIVGMASALPPCREAQGANATKSARPTPGHISLFGTREQGGVANKAYQPEHGYNDILNPPTNLVAEERPRCRHAVSSTAVGIETTASFARDRR